MLALFCLCLFCVLIWEILAGGSSAQLTKLKYGEHTIRKTVLACMPALSPDLFFFTIFFRHHKNQSIFPHSRHRVESNGKRPTRHLCSALRHGLALPWACPGGNSCQEPSNTQTWLPFCISFFSNTSSDILIYVLLIYIGSSLFLQAAQPMLKLKSHQCFLSKYQFYLARKQSIF